MLWYGKIEIKVFSEIFKNLVMNWNFKICFNIMMIVVIGGLVFLVYFILNVFLVMVNGKCLDEL